MNSDPSEPDLPIAERIERAAEDQVTHQCDLQLVVCSLALTSLLRPGWEAATRTIAQKLKAEEMFNRFRQCNTDSIEPQRSFLDLPPKS